MWLAGIKITVAYLVTAAFQLSWHWFLSKPYGLSQSLLRFYLSYDARVGKGVAGWFDLVLPCVWLGLITGLVGWNWSIRKLACFVIIVAVGLVALLPSYLLFLDKDAVWWWPKTNQDLVIFFIRNIIQTALTVGAFAYGGRCFGVYFHPKGH